MSRIRPDGAFPHLEHYYLRSTILAAIDTELNKLDGLHDPNEIAPLLRLRARFQPTEGENGHE